jgi:bifunctional ADP-heptose synthase (sugar kinase/adenylyltransferase)
VICADACFALLQVGPMLHLRAARALSDLLIVAVNTDQSLHLN